MKLDLPSIAVAVLLSCILILFFGDMTKAQLRKINPFHPSPPESETASQPPAS